MIFSKISTGMLSKRDKGGGICAVSVIAEKNVAVARILQRLYVGCASAWHGPPFR
jgi:hypothetical protein